MTNKSDDNSVEVARINARALIITAVISAFSGFSVAAVALIDRNGNPASFDATDIDEAGLNTEGPVGGEDLRPSICTTTTGEVGVVVLSTNIFNSQDSSNGFVQNHDPSDPGRYVFSNNDIGDVLGRQSQVPPEERIWGAMWRCVR